MQQSYQEAEAKALSRITDLTYESYELFAAYRNKRDKELDFLVDESEEFVLFPEEGINERR